MRSLTICVVLCAFVAHCSATDGHFEDLKDVQLADLKVSATFLAKYANKPSSKEAELWLKAAREKDSEDCLLRALCEAVARQDDGDSTLLKQLRELFGRTFENETLHFKKESYEFPYKYAAYIGSTQDPSRTCGQTFPICTVKPESLLVILNNLAHDYKI